MNITTYADYPPVPQRWLAFPFLPLDVMTLAAGGCGILKGTSMASVIAAVTHGIGLFGNQVPNGLRRSCAVISITPEDRSRQAMAYRLLAAGADPRLVINLTYDRLDPDDPERALKWKLDALGLANIREAWQYAETVLGVPVGLVYIDPMKEVVRGVSTNDQYRDLVVSKLDDLAAELGKDGRPGAAVLLVNHLTKEGSIAGSQGLVDAARITLMFEPWKVNPEIKTLSVYKSNIGPRNGVPALRYREVGADYDTTRRVEWETLSAPLPVQRVAPDNHLRLVPDVAEEPVQLYVAGAAELAQRLRRAQ